MRVGIACGLWVALAGCGDGDAPPAGADAGPPLRWACPDRWVPHVRGGCAPAAVACATRSAPPECDALDLHARVEVADPDGVIGIAPYLDDADQLAGGWPNADWRPETGIAECPARWSPDGSGGCDPMLLTTCDGSGPIPGGECATSTACPPGRWPDLIDDPAVTTTFFVDAAADPSVADGTQARPFATIGAALAVSEDAGYVYVAAGTYPEHLVEMRPGNRTVVGLCSARVRIAPATPGPAVHAGAPAAVLTMIGVSLAGSSPAAALSEAGGMVRVYATVIESVPDAALVARGTGSELYARSVSIRNTGAPAVEIREGAAASLERVSIANAAEIGLLLTRGAVLEAADLSIQRTRRNAAGDFGRAVNIGYGAGATIHRLAIEDVEEVGIAVGAENAQLIAEDVWIRGVVATPAAVEARGINVQAGRVDAQRVTIADVEGIGLHAIGADATLNLTEGAIRRIAPAGETPSGWGVSAVAGATMELGRLRIAEATTTSILASDRGSRIVLADAEIGPTRTAPDGNWGRGLLCQGGAELEVDRVRITGSSEAAANAVGYDSLLLIRDALIDEVGPTPRVSAGHGIDANSYGTVIGHRVRVERAFQAGIVAGLRGNLDLRDAFVTGTRPSGDGTAGHGIVVGDGSLATMRRVAVSGVVESGVFAYFGAGVDIEDLFVERVGASGRGFGIGIGSFTARVTVRRASVREVLGAGLVAARFSRIFMTDQIAELTAEDVFLDEVGRSTVQLEPTTVTPLGEAVSYGFHVGQRSTATITRFVAEEAGFGFYAADGAMALHTGVLARQLDAAGAEGNGTVSLADVAFVDNARDEVVARRDLPEASSLPPPSAVCVDSCIEE